MSWFDNISNQKVESIKYAINYELDNNEKKLLELSKNHTYLVKWITEPFEKFGYAKELMSVRKYYRMNSLQEKNYMNVSAILDWNIKSLDIKNRVKYFFLSLFVAKDISLIKSFLFYLLFFESIIVIFKSMAIKLLMADVFKLILLFTYSIPIIVISSLFVNLMLPLIMFYKKGIFIDLYGNKQEQEKTKKLALDTIMKLSGVYEKINIKKDDETDFLLSVELLSKKYQNGTIEKLKNENPYINFCEEIYEKNNLLPKVNYSYEELLQKNKEKLVLENKESLEKLLTNELKEEKVKKQVKI
ncbi:hypothetical protein GW796_00010 [archaeon]|nr:hypothetical protein [archaeon]